MSEDKKLRARYRTTNWREYNAGLKARGLRPCGWTRTCNGWLANLDWPVPDFSTEPSTRRTGKQSVWRFFVQRARCSSLSRHLTCRASLAREPDV